MSKPTCNENWHIFKNILETGQICVCGQKRTTATPGQVEEVNDLVSYGSKSPQTHTKSAHLTEATQERKDIP